MPYHVRVSSMIVFLRIGSLTLLTQSQLVMGSWTTSPVSHNPGLVVRPLLANSSLLGSTYAGSRPVTRSVTSVTTTRTPITNKAVFKAFIIFVLPTYQLGHPSAFKSGLNSRAFLRLARKRARVSPKV